MNYYVRTEAGVEHGPLTGKQLRDAAKSGSLSRRDLLRPDGTVDWFRADKVRGLEFADAQPAPGSPTPVLSIVEAVALPQHSTGSSHSGVNPAESAIYIEPLAGRGFNVRRLPAEEVRCVEEQGFWDAFRISGLAAFRGKRGVCILTNRRMIVAQATSSIKRIDVVHSECVEQIGIRWCVDWFWLVIGIVGCLMALSTLLVGVAIPLYAQASLDGSSSFASQLTEEELKKMNEQLQLFVNLSFVSGGTLLALSVFVVLVLSRYRAIEFGAASGSVRFAKRRLDQELLSQAESAREECRTHLSSGATDDAHIS